ncbi:MAG TPA: hemimethylated DNA-binding YccV-like domain-containing protein [Caulobacteraceae bacterium]|nr:hemimethylated DNA-binding YccV-like domain-containing protein [Caulobacteraceae bacterium]
MAYVSEQNLLPDDSGKPVAHPQTELVFSGFDHGRYRPKPRAVH